MDKEHEIVAKKIESGEYFKEAMSWFHVKFTRPRTEASYFFIICCIALLALAVGFITFSSIFPLSPGANFVVGRELSPNERVLIKSIKNSSDTTNDAVMKFMLKEYVIAREEYVEERLDRNFRIVTSFSDDKVYQQFLAETSMSNPENPIVMYGKQATKEITIDSIRLVDANGADAHDGAVKRAIVRYKVALAFINDNTQEITRHEADITFQYKQIIVDQKTGKLSQEPTIQITGYKTKVIQN